MNYIEGDAWERLVGKVLSSDYTNEQKLTIIESIMQCPEYIGFDIESTETQISAR